MLTTVRIARQHQSLPGVKASTAAPAAPKLGFRFDGPIRVGAQLHLPGTQRASRYAVEGGFLGTWALHDASLKYVGQSHRGHLFQVVAQGEASARSRFPPAAVGVHVSLPLVQLYALAFDGMKVTAAGDGPSPARSLYLSPTPLALRSLEKGSVVRVNGFESGGELRNGKPASWPQEMRLELRLIGKGTTRAGDKGYDFRVSRFIDAPRPGDERPNFTVGDRIRFSQLDVAYLLGSEAPYLAGRGG